MTVRILTLQDKAHHRMMQQAFALRHQVFAQKLGWVPTHPDCIERDEFDGDEALYFVHVEADGTVSGCFRLLPTTQPYLLNSRFKKLLQGVAEPNDPKSMEVSRFCVAPDVTPAHSRIITNRLLRAMYGFGLHNGLREFICVTDVLFERLLGRAGLRTERFGPPRQYDHCQVVAGRAPISQEVLQRLMIRAGTDLTTPQQVTEVWAEAS